MPLLSYDDLSPAFSDIASALTRLSRDYLPETGGRPLADTPRQYVFLLTDGVQSTPDDSYRGITGSGYAAACEALKAKGAILLVLHTQFYNAEGAFDTLMEAQPAVTAALQACASSPAHYFPVTETDSINTAMNAMLAIATVNPARFTR